jgi:hypothetical protein
LAFQFVIRLTYYSIIYMPATENVVKYLKRNKKFRQELIDYFPWYDTGHIENDASNNSIVVCVFVTALTFLPNSCLATIVRFLPSRCLTTISRYLPSRCLATIGGLTEPLLTNDKAISTGPLPSNDRRYTQTDTHRRAHTHTWSHKPTQFYQNRKVG